MLTYSCKRCGHSWLPRSEKKPTKCPKCIRLDWDEDKTGPEKPIEKKEPIKMEEPKVEELQDDSSISFD